jgi:hypothetical protein
VAEFILAFFADLKALDSSTDKKERYEKGTSDDKSAVQLLTKEEKEKKEFEEIHVSKKCGYKSYQSTLFQK